MLIVGAGPTGLVLVCRDQRTHTMTLIAIEVAFTIPALSARHPMEGAPWSHLVD